MRIAISADHRGAQAVDQVAAKLRKDGHDAAVHGNCGAGTVCDYPDNAYIVAKAVSEGRADVGILVCGSGIGMSIAANKLAGVRAALVHDELTAQIARSHNNANVLCLSADLLGQRLIEKIVDVFIQTPFEGGRHARRVGKISLIEQGKDPSQLRE